MGMDPERGLPAGNGVRVREGKRREGEESVVVIERLANGPSRVSINSYSISGSRGVFTEEHRKEASGNGGSCTYGHFST